MPEKLCTCGYLCTTGLAYQKHIRGIRHYIRINGGDDQIYKTYINLKQSLGIKYNFMKKHKPHSNDWNYYNTEVNQLASSLMSLMEKYCKGYDNYDRIFNNIKSCLQAT